MTNRELFIQDLLIKAAAARKKEPHLRFGQSIFNALFDTRKDIANSIKDDKLLNPFYNDANIPNLISHLLNTTSH